MKSTIYSCDICGKEMLSFNSTKIIVTISGLRVIDIKNINKTPTFSAYEDVCDSCSQAIAVVIETLKPKINTDEIKNKKEETAK